MPDQIATIGDNLRDPAPAIVARLGEEYASFALLPGQFEEEIAALPLEIKTKDENDKYADLLTRIRERRKSTESVRVSEKDPFLKSERAVDGFFVPVVTALDNQMATISRRTTMYLQAIEREARRVRDAEAAEARRQAQAKREEEEAAAARAAAAKRQDTQDRYTKAADTAAREAQGLEDAAGRAEASAAAKPADLVRQRSAAGTTSTLKSFWTYEIEDAEAIPLDALRPYFSSADIDRAVAAFVKLKTKGLADGQQAPTLAGVRIYRDSSAVHR